MCRLIGRKRYKPLRRETAQARLQLGYSGQDALSNWLGQRMRAIWLGTLEVFRFELWVLGDDGLEEVEDNATHNLSGELTELDRLRIGAVLEHVADAGMDALVALVKLSENIFSGLRIHGSARKRLTSDSAGLRIIPIPGDMEPKMGFTEESRRHGVMAYYSVAVIESKAKACL